MNFGLSSADRTIVERLGFAPLRLAGGKVYIFGSRARGDFREFSGLDILFEPPAQFPQQLAAKIAADLEDSSLRIKVDLVRLDELAVSYSAQVMRERREVKS